MTGTLVRSSCRAVCVRRRENHIALLSIYFVVDGDRSIGECRGRGVRRPMAATQSPHGKLNIPCGTCHTAEDWKVIPSKIRFNHAQTGFPLRGRHTAVACRDCHADLNFANTPDKCQDCHADFHRRKNGAECELCHNTNGWQVSIHNINEHQDRFPLIGAHAVVDCYSCHKVGTVGQFNRFGLSTECISCHASAFNKASAPKSSRFGLFYRLPRVPFIDGQLVGSGLCFRKYFQVRRQ